MLFGDGLAQDILIRYGPRNTTTYAVPTGYFLIVTWVSMVDTNIDLDAQEVYGEVGSSVRGGIDSHRRVRLRGNISDVIVAESSLSPLVIVLPGRRLRASNYSTSGETVEFEFRGFLVPSLTY